MSLPPQPNQEELVWQHLAEGVSMVGWWLWALHKHESVVGGPVDWLVAEALRFAAVNQVCNLLEEQRSGTRKNIVSLRTLKVPGDPTAQAAAKTLFDLEAERVGRLRKFRHKVVAHSDGRTVRRQVTRPEQPPYEDLRALYLAMARFLHASLATMGISYAILLDPTDAELGFGEPRGATDSPD